MSDSTYQVLARKYRPETFADLIGQDAMVRTLRNAFEADRIAHAFLMTGIRGTGKTTTARIIAKGLNCIGADGQGGPTTQPCGVCEPCVAISEGRHVDVMEMDAASRTGVGDIREIIDSVRYRAASARYKVYIIDEVHMLSTSAFNALLKTLEEPPEHVKFIFATTEIRKVPVTVLSRCQRFDLRRMEPEETIRYLGEIAGKEGAAISEDALALITRAAEGSMRDAVSLLDQAISHGAGETTADQVRAMLGVADRGRVLDLFDMVMKGDAGGALDELSGQYAAGADPLAVLRDLAEVTHWISVVKITPEAAEDPTVAPDERLRGQDMAERLPMRVLSRSWQMLLKALEEVAAAPNAMMAAEMAIIRLTHVADLPSPEELIRRLQDAPAGAPAGGGQAGASSAGASSPRAQVRQSGGVTAVAEAQPVAAEAANPLARFVTFEDVVALIRANRDVKLLVEVETYMRLAKYTPGRIEFEPTADAPPHLAQTLTQRLTSWTGARWAVSVVSEGGGQTLAELNARAKDDILAHAKAHTLVQAALAQFPGSEIRAVLSRELESDTNETIVPIDPDDVDDDWAPVDPFDDM
ncbi:DNA polymerase III subunit gamma/tau [Pontivivens insulae]|uniref:DNA polymerase III subunit gamma/tau n=1 Tax=Pontivivens insulae TaxID=1639689 RepID=A0A2R8ABN1_9RHOB|nr:DNA polymerase III subunit gamma/tau [Pontivivens insulae]RED11177.1 DNA polymerase-3 subunit gamma/tau [Pontivivens insulae]SPF29649.1 DNA polymerase III subunit tau [Pontivivens insulae]